MKSTFYEPRIKDGKIIAFADVTVAEGVIVKGFRIVRGERGLFASVPSRSFTLEGRTRYAHQVVFSDPGARARFLGELLEDYNRWERERTGAVSALESHAPADELVE